VKYWDWIWLKTPTGATLKVRALDTEPVGPGSTRKPFHIAGRWQGKDQHDK
jgi:formate dehydrogenase major subunit